MREEDEVIAIAVSDLHLSHTPPIARSCEDWYGVMRKYCCQLTMLCRHYRVPILCAGDVFNRYDEPPELVNFALIHLPHMYTIPGQHDLPNHNLEDMEKSAYYTLVAARKVDHLYARGVGVGTMRVHPFPWGREPEPCRDAQGLCLEVAVIHKYIWMGDHKYKGAPDKANLTRLKDKLKGYHVVIVGDNHKGFLINGKGNLPTVLNCGTFIRRKIDEIDYQPCVGLIHASGKVTRYKLDTSEDKFLDARKRVAKAISPEDMEKLAKAMSKLASLGLDFEEALMKHINNKGVSRAVRQLIYALVKEESGGD